MGVRDPLHAVGAGKESSGEKTQDGGCLHAPSEGGDEGYVQQEEEIFGLDKLEGSGEA